MSSPIRVLIADDSRELREALADVLKSDPRCELVGQAADAREAIQLAEKLKPDVAVLDVKMPEGGGALATTEIRRLSPATHILGFSAYGDSDTVFDLLRRGASGFIVKGSAANEVVEGVVRANAGESPLSRSLTHDVVGRAVHEWESESEATSDRKSRSMRLNNALRNLRIAYQPIVRLLDRGLVGYEALSRFSGDPAWPPDRWFAEAADLGALIDSETVAAKAALAGRPGAEETYLSINVSPQTILAGRLADLIATESGPCVLEVTEHAPVADYDALGKALARLRKGSVRLAIDDAGAGFASLRHILLLEPQIIKLDLSLTRGIDKSGRTRSLAAALAQFADEIDATVVAEGVETEAERRALIDLGVAHGQGFLFGRPEVMD